MTSTLTIPLPGNLTLTRTITPNGDLSLHITDSSGTIHYSEDITATPDDDPLEQIL